MNTHSYKQLSMSELLMINGGGSNLIDSNYWGAVSTGLSLALLGPQLLIAYSTRSYLMVQEYEYCRKHGHTRVL